MKLVEIVNQDEVIKTAAGAMNAIAPHIKDPAIRKKAAQILNDNHTKLHVDSIWGSMGKYIPPNEQGMVLHALKHYMIS